MTSAATLMRESRAVGQHVASQFSLARKAMADTQAMADSLANGLDRNLRRAFEQLALRGASLRDVLRDMALSLAQTGLSASIAPLSRGLSGLIGNALSGGLLAPGQMGGVLGQLTLPDLGIGKSAVSAPRDLSSRGEGPKVVVNITTPDAASFRRAEGQVAASLARMVDRGRRHS